MYFLLKITEITIWGFTAWVGQRSPYLLVVHHLELEAQDRDAVLVLQRLLHRVVVDVPVDQVELQGVAGDTGLYNQAY